MVNKISKLLCVAGIAFAGAVAAPAAHADTTRQNASCVINYIQYSADQLVFRCSGSANFYGVFGPSFTGCGYKQTADSLKVMTSLAQSAYLSGKNVLFNYFDVGSSGCTGGPPVVLMSLGVL